MTDHSADEHAALAAILDRVYGLLPPGANYGQILRTEAEFLADRVLERRPSVFLEIGTASGVSSAVVYAALQRLGGEFSLIATEALEYCYFDREKKPGFIFRAAHPGPTPGFSLYTGSDSFGLEGVLGGQPVDFVFIDGNHTHPWAAIDTILTLPFLAEGATLAYHDLNLHHRGGATKALDKGPHQLFYHLSAVHKVVLGEFPYPNIGALRLDGGLDVLASVVEIMLAFPWVRKDWPTLDQGVLDRLCAFVGHHWGAVMGEWLAVRLAERAPLEHLEADLLSPHASATRNYEL